MVAAIIVLSALMHAGWNAALRVEGDKDLAVVIAIAAGAVVASAAALVQLALGAALMLSPQVLLWTAFSGLCQAVYFAALARALALGPLGVVYTISRGGTVPLVWIASVAIWGELISPLAMVGSMVVLIGLFFSGSNQRGAKKTSRHAVGWATACAVLVAAYNLAYKETLELGGSSAAVFALSLSLASAINLVRLGRARRTSAKLLLRTRYRTLLPTGALCAASFLVFLEGLARGGAGFAITLRNTSVLFAMLLAWRIGDVPTRRQVLGAVLVTSGAVVLAFGQA